jgi:hypothetical protein
VRAHRRTARAARCAADRLAGHGRRAEGHGHAQALAWPAGAGDRRIRRRAGLLTPVDILEAIAGEFPDEDEQLAIRLQAPGRGKRIGAADLHLLEQVLETDSLAS